MVFAPCSPIYKCALSHCPGNNHREEPSALHRDEEVLGELPFNVYPLRNALKACASGHFLGFVPPIFMTTLGPDRLIATERETGIFYRDRLEFNGAEMHLDSVLPGVVEGYVLESGQVEIASKLAVDTGKQIAIEGLSHTKRVIIGGDELSQWLL
jgi:hypothetical protein